MRGCVGQLRHKTSSDNSDTKMSTPPKMVGVENFFRHNCEMWNLKKTFDWKRTEYICDLQLRRFWQSTTFILEMRFRQMQKILNSSIFWSFVGKHWTWCKMHAKIFIMSPLLQKYSFSVVFQRIKNLKLFTNPTKPSSEKFRISVQSS